MAESAVSFLLDKLSELLINEGRLLGGLEREVQSIRDEMLQMKEFLRGSIESDDSNPSSEWIRQLRDIAYDVEDVIDKYMFQFQRRRVANGFKGCIKKACGSIKDLIPRRQIASEIQDIKRRLKDVTEIRKRYIDANACTGQGSSSGLQVNECYDGRDDALFLDDDDVVGIEKPKKTLLKWVHSRHDGLEVISVVGMGGLGKTTLVTKVYNDESIKIHFNSHVYIIASEYKDDKQMLANLIGKLYSEIKGSSPPELGGKTESDMRQIINDFLQGKNYIIVLDDVWDISKWHAIRPALPKSSVDGNHGCTIITTRSRDIANQASSHVYELKPLPEKESWELFQKKAFSRNLCPDHIEEYAEKILKKCQGLPLAISVIGGLLATKNHNAEEWDLFERSLDHELKDGGSLEKLLKRLISLSYNHLPWDLKYCYLYLSIFPEDNLLEKEMVIRLWIAEGFVHQPKNKLSMYETADWYLNELYNRSLIQVAERNVDGRARAFRIHDLLRDHIVSKSEEHNIVTIYNGGEMQHPGKVRRLAIHKSFSFSQDTFNLGCLRSLLLLCSEDMELGMINELVGRSNILKVLELRGAPLESIPKEVFKLYYLKHLSLRNTMVKLIQKSIRYLVNLETLDLKNCYVTELPKEILELHRLRYLFVYRYKCLMDFSFDNLQSCKAPCGIGRSLSNLIKLSCIDANESDGMKMVREIGKLTQLRRLGIAKLRNEDGEELCSSIAKLNNLRSLRIDSVEEGEKLDLNYSIKLEFLRRLELFGSIEKIPEWINSLNSLTSLRLCWSRLREDPMDSLQEIQQPGRVRRLAIHKSFSFSQDTFNLGCLRSLILLCSEVMELGMINELVGRSKILKVLELRGAPLESIPEEVFKLYYLKHLSLRNTAVKLIQKSIRYLVNLETLDLKNCNVIELPKEILELHRLRHLLVYRHKCPAWVSIDYIQSCKAPCGIGRSLSNLIKLDCVDATESDGMKMVREIGKLTQLRRLGIAKLRSEDGEELCSSIAKLKDLRSLIIASVEEGEKLDLDYPVKLEFLSRLALCGRIDKVPKWIKSLNSLTSLSLRWSKLREDPMDSLQDLPHLVDLLIHDAYFERLTFKTRGFKKLKELWLRDLKYMNCVIVEKGSMPNLQEWTMMDCKLVRELPQGIEHLPRLQTLNFDNMGDEFVNSVVEEKRNGGVHWRLSHVPQVRFFKVMNDGTLDFDFAL